MIKLTENELRSMINEIVTPLMTMVGRRESTNVEDRRGETRLSKIIGMADNFLNMYLLLVSYEPDGGNQFISAMFGQQGSFSPIISKLTRAYTAVVSRIKAQTPVGKVKTTVKNAYNKVRSQFNEGIVPGDDETEMQRGMYNAERVKKEMAKLVTFAASEFTAMMKEYEAAVMAGKMNPKAALNDLDRAYREIMTIASWRNR